MSTNFPEQPIWQSVPEIQLNDRVKGGLPNAPANAALGILTNRTFVLKIIANLNVKSCTTVAPDPSDPDGTQYIVPASGGQNEFANPGLAAMIAFKMGGIWNFLRPGRWLSTVQDQPNVLLRYDGSQWVAMSIGGNSLELESGQGQPLSQLGAAGTLSADDLFYVVQSGESKSVEFSQMRQEFNQSVASSTWTIAHNMGRKPSVQIVINGEVASGDINHIDDNNLVIIFTATVTGSAFLS